MQRFNKFGKKLLLVICSLLRLGIFGCIRLCSSGTELIAALLQFFFHSYLSRFFYNLSKLVLFRLLFLVIVTFITWLRDNVSEIVSQVLMFLCFWWTTWQMVVE